MGIETPDAAELLQRRKQNWSHVLAQKGWYHSLELPDGTVLEGVIPLDRMKHRAGILPIPKDLRGKRVLDIGAWDGFFSFEMERRGAQVTAIDCVEVENFVKARRLMASRVDYREMDVMEISEERLGTFDVVLFLGVLYHLKHPLAALEKVCALTRDIAIVESHVVRDLDPVIPVMEFYETAELGNQLDNWFGPTVECLAGLCRTAGFARVELLEVFENRACFACWRHWPDAPGAVTAPKLLAAAHNWDGGINFRTTRDDYVACVFESSERDLTRWEVYPEIGGFGVIPIHVDRVDEQHWKALCKLPPGIRSGWQEVRVRVRQSGWSNTARIAVDLPFESPGVEIYSVADAADWTAGVVHLRPEAFMALWIRGLPDHADRNNLKVLVDGERQTVEYIGEIGEKSLRQVNVRLRQESAAGTHSVVVRFGAAESEAADVRFM